MARRPRTDYAGALHHVMNRGVDHQQIFFGDDDRIEFGRRLADIHQRFGIETLAYCLMTNHYHLLLRTPDAMLSKAMQHLGLVYTRHTNDRVDRDGPIFRGRFHSINVTTDAYLLLAARYIHRNPLDIAGVQAPTDYRWSSYRSYRGLRRAPTFLHTDLLLEMHGDRSAFQRFTDDARDVHAWLGCSLTIEDLRQLVQFAIADDDLRHGEGHDSRRIERSVLIMLAERLADDSIGADLDRWLAFPTDAARNMARSRARARVADPAVQRVLGFLLDALPLAA